MPYKDHRKQQDYKNRHHDARRRKFWLLKAGPCMDCGVSYPHYQMEFDHVPERGSKSFTVAAGVNNKWSRLLDEISKCDLVCCNCHAARTWFRQQASKNKT